MSERIAQGSRVTLHFALKLDDGEMIESTFGRTPATLVMGDGSLLEGFEAVLEGMAAGEQKTATLAPEQAFGLHREENLQRMARARFAGMELEPGLIVNFADKGGASLPGVVVDIADEVTVDFNHPLAGRTMVFEVSILDVGAA